MNTFLDRLELHGFKSFPEKTVIRFHRGITAVVGPNGCGKSNIVDAILWVLGEQRIKNLRGENNEDLIFNGSASKKPLGMTEVAATFQTGGEPVYIARRFFRTGEGRYVHNERTVRHKDIQDELFKMNLGGTGYYIFEQGSIEKLLALKPTEQRVLIEEAAGIAKYLERKKETAGKLIVSQQNLENIDILLADKGERLKDLRNQVNYVQRYRKTKEEWQRVQKTVIHRKYIALSGEFEQRRQRIETLLNEETALGRQVMALETTVMEGEEKRWRFDQQLKDTQKKSFEINRRLTAMKGDYEKLTQRQDFLRQRIGELSQASGKGSDELEDLSAQQDEAGEALRRGISVHSNLEKELAKLVEAQKKRNERRGFFLDKEKEFQKKVFEVQAELSKGGNELRELEKNLMRAENDILARQKIILALKEQGGQSDQKEIAEQLAQVSAEYEALSLRRREGEKQLSDQRACLQDAEENCRVLTGNLQSLSHTRRKVEELKGKLIRVDERPASGSESWRLQEHIEARPEDRLLLESFYYDLMDAPLVDGSDEGLVARLDKVKLNRPLPAVDWEELRRLPGCEGTVHDLFTLRVAADKNVFPNGLVVKDLGCALRLFLEKGIPLVTRDGTTVSADGLLFRKREKGVLDVLAELRRIEKEQGDTQLRLKSAQENRSKLEKDYQEMQRRLTGLTDECRETEKEVMRLRSDLESRRRQEEQNRRRIELTQAEIDMAVDSRGELEELRLESQKRLAAAEGRLKSLTGEKDAFQRENQVFLSELAETEKLLLQKRHECQLERERIDVREQQKRRLRQQLDRLKSQLEQSQRDVEKYQAELAALDQEKRKNRDQEVLLKREIKGVDAEIEACEKGLEKINADLKAANEGLNRGRKQLEEAREKRAGEDLAVSGIKKDLFSLQETAFKELNLELAEIEAEAELAAIDLEALSAQSDEMEERLRRMRDSDRLNFSAESEYDLLMKEHGFLEGQKQDVLTSIADMTQAMEKIDNESRQKFHLAFREISENFINNFKILFEGGEAELSLMDPENVLETGLEIKAQPPGKRLQGLRLLSGGEKTLTSLAFLFALFQYKPSPFCVFDEVDASLDEANIQRFLKFLHILKANTQFLIITHNFKTMEEADFIYGISMNEPGISSVYSMKLSGKETLVRMDG